MADENEEIDRDNALLTKEDKDFILGVLKARNAPRACEMCGVDSWYVGDFMTSPVIVDRLPNGGVTFLMAKGLHTSATLLCQNCGNTKLFNLPIIGATELTVRRKT